MRLHFLSLFFQFRKSQCPSGSKYPEFSNTPPTFAFWMSLRVVMAIFPINYIFLGTHCSFSKYCTLHRQTLLTRLMEVLLAVSAGDTVSRDTELQQKLKVAWIYIASIINSYHQYDHSGHSGEAERVPLGVLGTLGQDDAATVQLPQIDCHRSLLYIFVFSKLKMQFC